MRTCTLVVVITVAMAAFARLCPVQAASTETISTTCRAAADADKRVSYGFCRRRLIAYRGASEADVWGLAKIAAVIGVNHADAARYEIESRMRRDRNPKFRRALEQCQRLYESARAAYAAANEALIDRRFAAAKERLMGIPTLGHECEFAFAGTGRASPLMFYSVDNQQIAYIALGITNLVTRGAVN